ncbi:MAG: exodeoxyribonuclease VII large subunit [Christensenellaceae bacterium]
MDNLIISVHELNTYVSDKLSADPFLEEVWVRGEITDFKFKHNMAYFSLKDEQSIVECMLFNCDEVMQYIEQLYDGQTIVVRGDISVYWKNGKYRIIVKEITFAGMGEMYAKFNILKERLETQGIFAEEHKKALPKIPQKIGIVTSKSGAVIEDIKNIANRRNPLIRLLLYSVKVQGEDAPSEIVKGIEYFNKYTDVDLLIVGRGGGSAEDLFAFNDESVVMAIYHSKIPVISAVGHETDFTLSDMAADLRAPTPSAAAEIAITLKDELVSSIKAYKYQIQDIMKTIFYEKRMQIKYNQSLLSKDAVYAKINLARYAVQSNTVQIEMQAKTLYNRLKVLYNHYKTSIELLNPMGAFERGYSVAIKNGSEIKSIKDVAIGDEIKILLKDGTLLAGIMHKEENK